MRRSRPARAVGRGDHRAQLFRHTPALRTPVLVAWGANLGGAFQSPVITYFYLNLGISIPEIGKVGFIISITNVLLAPMYGWVVDHKGPYLAIFLSCFFCGVGCLVRGIAYTLPSVYMGALAIGMGGEVIRSVVLSHVTGNTDPADRSLVVGGYSFQLLLLKILGRLLYPIWNISLIALSVDDSMTRHRATLAFCTVACLSGCALLLWNRSDVDHAGYRPVKTDESEMIAPFGDDSESEDSVKKKSDKITRHQSFAFAFVLGAFLFNSIGLNAANILWPLFGKAHFNWDTSEFSVVLFLSTLGCAAAVAVFPHAEHRLGKYSLASYTCMASAILCSVSFLVRGTSDNQSTLVFIHSAVHMSLLSLFTLQDAALKALGSSILPSHLQGRAFGIMSMVYGAGETFSHIASTWMFQLSIGEDWPIIGGGALPLVVYGVFICLSITFILLARFVAQ